MRDSDGFVLCHHGRPIRCLECGDEYEAELDKPAPPASSPPERSEGVTRFEVIDHRNPTAETGDTFGRVFSAHGCRIELSYQDGGQTLKVFVHSLPPEPSNG
jgi:hypothetical protein